MQQILLAQTNELSQKDLIEIPTILKDKVLMAPGEWNGIHYTAEEIRKAYKNTDWENKDITSIILDHADKPLSVHDWVGFVENPRLEEDLLVGDLILYDENVLVKLIQAKMKCGISPRVRGIENEEHLTDFTFENFSIVTNPAVKKAYINLSESKKLKEVTGMEEERKKRGMSVTEFYAAPRNPPSKSTLPIFDAAHVRNALARFNQTNFLSPEEKTKAWNKIVRAAKKFGIKTSKEMSNLIKLNGGKMTEKEIEEEVQEVKEEPTEEEPKEESKEEPKEEVQEEAPKEEPEEESKEEAKEEPEEESEEESEEEELSEKEILEITKNSKWSGFVEKYMSKNLNASLKEVVLAFKAKEEPEDEKDEQLKELAERIKEMSENEKQLSEQIKELKVKLDEPGAKSVQELSAKPRDTSIFSDEASHHSAGTLEMANFLKNFGR